MARKWPNRVLETSTTTGTSDFTLAGNVTGYQRFSDECSVNDTCEYFIEAVDSNGVPTGDWEQGDGTYSATNTLARTTVRASSNSDAAVNFGAGTKRVAMCFSGRRAQSVASIKAPPGGRLTLVTGTPVMTSDQTAKTAIYYTPYVSDVIPIFDGIDWFNQIFTELTLNLDTSNHLLDTLYDIFVWNNAGTISIGTGPAWNRNATITVTIATPAVVSWTAHGLNEGDPIVFTTTGALPTGITAGTTYYVSRSPGANSFNISTSRANAAAGTLVATSGSQSGTHTATVGVRQRGTGAGTTELEMKNGIWTNKNSITLKNGAGAGTSGIAANTATYVGTAYMTANGQTGMAFTPAAAAGGTNNILGLFNAYNRVHAIARERDSNGNWTYNSTTWRCLDGASANPINNRISYIDGLQVLNVSAVLKMAHVNGSGNYSSIGMNANNTTAAPNSSNQLGSGTAGTAGAQTINDAWMPSLGLNFIQAMEMSAAGTGTFYANETSPTRNHMMMTMQIEM